ncbi:hypothetical protein, partial [Blautia wexlerae]|uniref:hypothetical protein n=1 Tax=Blautia wexlerae TaxID=418240 RepID=UPI0034A340D7
DLYCGCWGDSAADLWGCKDYQKKEIVFYYKHCMISCSIRMVKGGYVKSYFYFGKKKKTS